MIDGTTPKELVFDDDMLDGILYDVDTPKAKPADFFGYWTESEINDPEQFDGIVRIVINGPYLIKSCYNVELREKILVRAEELLAVEKDRSRAIYLLAKLYSEVDHFEKAEVYFRQALAFKGESSLAKDIYWDAMNGLGKVLEALGKDKESREIKIVCRAETYVNNGNIKSLIEIRFMALNLFNMGLYASAEQLYRRLLEKRFQEQGTLIHLARVLFMQNRFAEAKQAVDEAWELSPKQDARFEDTAYVMHRILFFRTLCAMLDREDYKGHIVQLQKELHKNRARCIWTIEPLLEHIRDRLAPDDLTLITAIAEVINERAPLDSLEVCTCFGNAEQL